MSQDILGSLIRVLVTVPQDRLGLIQDLSRKMAKMAGNDGQLWEAESKRFLRKEPTWQTEKKTPAESHVSESILERVADNISVPATDKPFIAKNNFKLKKDGGICSYWGENFKEFFLKDGGKIEPPFAGSTLCSRKLLKAATDMPQNPGDPAIIPELGGEGKAETTLTELFSQMEKQKNGEEGILLTNGYANIFYIKDSAGVLQTVYAHWRDVGWYVRARSVLYQIRWNALYQVFSRNSVLKS